MRSPSHSTRSAAGSSFARARKPRTCSSIASASAPERFGRAADALRRSAATSFRWAGPNRSQLGKAHEQRADQADGIGILDAYSGAHHLGSSFAAPNPTRFAIPKGEGQYDAVLKVSPQARLEKSLVTLRKVPAALALGLLASMLAHGGLYGGEHAMGGGVPRCARPNGAGRRCGSLSFLRLVGRKRQECRRRRQRPGRPATRTASRLWIALRRGRCLVWRWRSASNRITRPRRFSPCRFCWRRHHGWLRYSPAASSQFWQAPSSRRGVPASRRERRYGPRARTRSGPRVAFCGPRRRFARPPPIGLDYCA